MDSTQSDTEKIRMALQVLYGGELEELDKKLLAMPIDLAHYKTFGMETEKYLNSLDRTQRIRADDFMLLEKEHEQIIAPFKATDTRGVYRPIFEFEERLIAMRKSDIADTVRWKIIARSALKRYMEKLEAYFKDEFKLTADEKEAFKHHQTEQLAIMTQEAEQLDVDIDLQKTIAAIEDKKVRVEAQKQVIEAELKGGIEQKSEVECHQAVKRFYAREGTSPNQEQFWREVGGHTYDRKNALKRLLKRGVLVEVKGKGRAIYLQLGEHPIADEPAAETHKVQLKRDLAENGAENEGKPA